MLFLTLMVWGMFAVVGAAIGNAKNRGGFGALMGILFGPIGWIIVAVMPVHHFRWCPACMSGVPYGATKCAHCASALPAMTPMLPTAPPALPQPPPAPVDPARPYGNLPING